MSLGTNGEQGNQKSYPTSVSPRARFVVFASGATGLVPGDTNSAWDVFLRDRENGTTERISLSSSGAEGNRDSANGSISADGRLVAFDSFATNLDSAPTGGSQNVYLRDRVAGTTVLLSDDGSGAGGGFAPVISPDGRFVAFLSSGVFDPLDDNSQQDVYLLDRNDGSFELVSRSSADEPGNSWSTACALSADGRHVAFMSAATNLVAGDTNGWEDVFVRDRVAGTTTRVSVDSSGIQGDLWSSSPSISADGRLVAFTSASTDLVAGDTNAGWDVFLHDRSTATTIRASVGSAGAQGDGWSEAATLSADGRFLAFHSLASNFDRSAPPGWHVYVRDLATGLTLRATTEATALRLLIPILSPDGRFVCFSSPTPFVTADTNGKEDVYIRRLF